MIEQSFWRTRARIRVLYGGRASGKTWNAAQAAIHYARQVKMKMLCTRQFQNRISESVYSVLKEQIEKFGLQNEFEMTINKIVHKTTKSEFIFLGLWRNIDEIKSLEGVDVCWIEEAHSLTKEQWDILEPTIRKEGSEFWIIFNPRLRTDFVYRNFIINKQPNSIVRKINYDENNYLSDTMLELIESKKKEDYEEFKHIYLGEPRISAEDSLFTYEELDTAMNDSYDAQKYLGVKVMGLDVARFGDDSTVLAFRRGYVVEKLQDRSKFNIVETANWTAFNAQQENVDIVVVDTCGVGGGALDIISSIGVRTLEGNAGMSADNPTYYNKRTEMYFNLKEALKNGLKLPKDDGLLEELMSVKYTYTDKGQIKLLAKDKLKEELGRSPDRADAVALTFFATIVPKSTLQDDWRGGY